MRGIPHDRGRFIGQIWLIQSEMTSPYLDVNKALVDITMIWFSTYNEPNPMQWDPLDLTWVRGLILFEYWLQWLLYLEPAIQRFFFLWDLKRMLQFFPGIPQLVALKFKTDGSFLCMKVMYWIKVTSYPGKDQEIINDLLLTYSAELVDISLLSLVTFRSSYVKKEMKSLFLKFSNDNCIKFIYWYCMIIHSYLQRSQQYLNRTGIE